MEETEVVESKDPAHLYKTQWRAYYKRGLGGPTIVYGETQEDALKAALAEYRRNSGLLENWPLNRIVDHVEYIG